MRSLPAGRQPIARGVSGTKIPSTSATSNRASQETLTCWAGTPSTVIIVIGTVTWAVPETCPSLVRAGVKLTAVVPNWPARKLLLKKAVAWADAVASRVVPFPVMNLRPARTPASQACWSRILTKYIRAASTAPPEKASTGTIIAAVMSTTLPATSRRSRASKPALYFRDIAAAGRLEEPRFPCPENG